MKIYVLFIHDERGKDLRTYDFTHTEANYCTCIFSCLDVMMEYV